MKDEVDFLPQINVKGFFKVIQSFKVCVARHAQITQNNEFAILQYFKKEVYDEVDFLYADKHEKSFLQINAMIFKEVRDEVDFLHADKHQSFYKLASSFLM